MDDRFLHDSFLHSLRRDPSREFATRLKVSLDAADERLAERKPVPRAARWAAVAASVAIVALAFTFPSVRAGAQAFLDLFRVGGVVGVSFDAERLHSELADLDLSMALDLDFLSVPGPPQSFGSPEDASAAAGIDVMEPAWLPVGFTRERLEVAGEYAARGAVQTDALELVMRELGIDDLAIPRGLFGETVTVRVPPVVHAAYGAEGRHILLWQARSPEVAFPAGVDIATFAVIALRILGLDAAEAYRLAGSFDWRSTLIVPVPISEASFRSVNIAGRDGLLVERDEGSMLLWTMGERVFVLRADLPPSHMLDIAESVQ